jgi:tetratricopeptide (TPR) repeat protein
VTAQLIEAETGMHLWAERFDRELSDIFAVQDEIVAAISGQLAYNLVDAAADLQRTAPTKSLTAYDYLLRGRASWRRGAIAETLDYYAKAAEADPQYAAALASLAFFYSEDTWMQMTGKAIGDLVKLARGYVDRAIAADNGDSFVHHMVGTALLDLGDLDRAKHHLELAISLNPHFPSSAINLGCAIAFMGRHREGLAITEKAFRLEPRLPPAMRAVPFYIHCVMGNPDAALQDLARIENPLAFLHLFASGCLAQAGREQEARHHIAAFQDKRPSWFDIPGFARAIGNCLRTLEDRKRLVDGLRKAGALS